MFSTAENITRLRSITMGITGLVCLLYAVLVATSGEAAPINRWLPAVFGVGAAVLIFISFRMANRNTGEMATDELYKAQNHLALRIGYWVALIMYPLFGFLIVQGYLPLKLAMPIMGTLTGAAYLLPFAYLTGRGT